MRGTALILSTARPATRRAGLSILLACGAALGFALGEPTSAPAQWADEPTVTPQQRAAQYDALARDVQALEQQGMVLRQLVKLVTPTIVHIEAEHIDDTLARYNNRRRKVEEAGSGVIVLMGDKYYIITNRHVVKGATQVSDIKVKLTDGREIKPTRKWEDQYTDLAVLAIDAPRLIPCRLGNSDAMEIGDFVVAVGSPFGLSHSVTFGIISAKGRRGLDLGDEVVKFQDFMQTDAAINPGNSGGPLMNLRGEVIGINTAIASSSGGSEGIGFTIPINMVMNIAKQLIDKGNVIWAYIGVDLDKNFGTDAASKLGLPTDRGARVRTVVPKSPAEAARLQTDDVVLEYNGIRVEDNDHLINLVSLTEIGREVPIVVYRSGKPVTLMVKVGERSKFEQMSK
jgi:serine protease Do